MRHALFFVTVLATVGCDKQVVVELSECQRNLGANEVYLARARTDQAAAEEKVTVLEEQLKATQEELAAAKSGLDNTPSSAAQEVVEVKGKRQALGSSVPRIGLSLPTQREERWIKDKLTMLTEAKKKGVELLVQVSNNDPARQAEQCEALIAQGIQVLILAPHDASSAATIIDKAIKAGVSVISYDRLVTDSPHSYYYVSFDNVKVGTIQGEFLTRRVRKGNYVILAGSPTDNNAKLFRQGAMKVIQPYVKRGDIKIVIDEYVKDWLPAEAQRLCDQALTATNNSVDAILAPNDGTAGGCIEALAAKGLAGKIPISGQDSELAAAIRVLRGTQSMTIFKDTRLLGKKAIEVAVELARGKSVDTKGRTISNNVRQVPAVLLPPYLVTKDNLDERLIKSGYLNKEAVYRK